MDLISRQQAIDALEAYKNCIKAVLGDENGNGFITIVITCRNIIDELPSVQPEIIMCKDCMYFDKGWCNLDTSMGMSDFCSRAKRRTDE